MHSIIGLLALLFLFAEAGNLLLWHAQRAQQLNIIKSDQHIDAGMVHFVFSKTEFAGLNWQKQNKEFVLNGEFYDIKHIKKTNTGYLVICKHDEKDKELFSRLGQWLSSNDGKFPNKSVKPLSKFIAEGTLVAYGFNLYNPPVQSIEINENQNILSGFPTLNDHPPKG